MFNEIKNIFNLLSNKLNNKVFKYIIFLMYLVLTFILILKHEVWMDEAQAWELARNLSIPDLIYQMRYEGHSCLWHLIIMPFAKLNFPIITINIISFIFVSIAVYMILFKASWNIFVKIIVIFNPAFIYYISVISRCYSLIPILLYLFVTYYDKRYAHPIIYSIILGLLAHTHIIMCPMVGVAASLYLIECAKKFKENKRNLFISFLILFIFFILLILQIYPYFGSLAFNGTNSIFYCILNVFKNISNYFLPSVISSNMPIVIMFIFVLIFICLFKYNKKFSFIYLITIMVFIYIHLYWHVVLYERIAVLFIFIVILNLYNNDKLNQLLLFVISLISVFSSSLYIYYDITGPFSACKEMGIWINENVEDDSLIIFMNLERDVAVPSYVTKNINYYDIRFDSYKTYINWKFSPSFNYNELLHTISKQVSDYKSIYIMHGSCAVCDFSSTENNIKLLLDDEVIKFMFSSYSNKIHNEKISIYKLVKI